MRRLGTLRNLAHGGALGLSVPLAFASFCEFDGGEPITGFLLAAATLACLGAALFIETRKT